MPEQDPEQGTALEQEWLCGRGEAADRIRCLDWSSTPLGPRATWPHSLRTLVNLLLAQPLPMLLLWGPEPSRSTTTATSHCRPQTPRAMGQPTRECWPEAWPRTSCFTRACLRPANQSAAPISVALWSATAAARRAASPSPTAPCAPIAAARPAS